MLIVASFFERSRCNFVICNVTNVLIWPIYAVITACFILVIFSSILFLFTRMAEYYTFHLTVNILFHLLDFGKSI